MFSHFFKLLSRVVLLVFSPLELPLPRLLLILMFSFRGLPVRLVALIRPKLLLLSVVLELLSILEGLLFLIILSVLELRIVCLKSVTPKLIKKNT